MTGQLRIRTFGSFEIRLGDEIVSDFTYSARKEKALLAYLAYSQRPYSRDVLAEIFWEDREQGRARACLKGALSSLRSSFGPFLDISRDRVVFLPDSDLWLDVIEFERCINGKPDNVERLEAALALYQGEFLEGFYIGSRAFEEWQLWEQGRLRLLACEVLDRLVRHYARADTLTLAIERANVLLRLDPLREKTYLKIMEMLVSTGQISAALDQYENCVRAFDDAGIEFTPELTQLHDRIRAGIYAPEPLLPDYAHDPHGAGDHALPPTNLAPQATTFIGRQDEVTELKAQLEGDACRLLTLTGAGGIGKTRMALALAGAVRARFPDGVFVVDLLTLQDAAAIPLSIANALGFRIQSGFVTPEDQLLHYLADKCLLLVLDNFEHLLDGVNFLERLLGQAQHVKLLVTSREVLGLSWEWCYLVQGLPVPEQASGAEAGASSVQLFVERARRVKHDFSLSENTAEVVQICQQVEGMPLGIELAAAWVRFMPCGDIARSLLDLEAYQHDIAPRHRSLRTLLENSWVRLSLREQALYRRLAIFRGGFTRDAAAAIVGATLPELAALANKSLLRVDPHTGRFTRHRLLYEIAEQKLAEHPDEYRHYCQRHCDYYATFIERQAARLHGGEVNAALALVDADIDNIRAAWQRALECQALETLIRLCAPVSDFHVLKCWNHEAVRMFDAGLAWLRQQPPTPSTARAELALNLGLAGPYAAIYGWTSPRLGEIYLRVRDLARMLGDDLGAFWALAGVALFYGSTDWRRALRYGQEAFDLAQELNERLLVVTADALMSTLLVFVGDFAQANIHQQRGIAAYDPIFHRVLASKLGEDLKVAMLSHGAWALFMLGYPDQSLWYIEEAQRWAEALNDPVGQVFALGLRAHLHVDRREHEAWMYWVGQLETRARAHDLHFWLHLAIPELKAIALVAEHRYHEGIAAIQHALELQRAYQNFQMVDRLQIALAWALARTGQVQAGLEELDVLLGFMEQSAARNYKAEALRTKAELLLLTGADEAAEAVFQAGIAVAQQQQARIFELRATTGLAQLWLRQGRSDDAQALLQPVYAWFTEGFDTLDIREAQMLLTQV